MKQKEREFLATLSELIHAWEHIQALSTRVRAQLRDHNPFELNTHDLRTEFDHWTRDAIINRAATETWRNGALRKTADEPSLFDHLNPPKETQP